MTLNKGEIIDEVQSLDWPTDKFIVFSGAVLALHDIRETSDIDIVVSDDLFSLCQESDEWKPGKQERQETAFLEKGIIEVASRLDWKDYSTTLAEAKEREDIISGIPCMSLPDLLAFKQAMNRSKDRDDIMLIKKHLQAN